MTPHQTFNHFARIGLRAGSSIADILYLAAHLGIGEAYLRGWVETVKPGTVKGRESLEALARFLRNSAPNGLGAWGVKGDMR